MYSNLTCLLLFVLFDGDPNAEGIQKLKLVRTHWERHLLEWDHKKWEPRLPSGANIFPFLWFWSVTCPEKQLQRKLDHTVKEERVHDVAQTKGKKKHTTNWRWQMFLKTAKQNGKLDNWRETDAENWSKVHRGHRMKRSDRQDKKQKRDL